MKEKNALKKLKVGNLRNEKENQRFPKLSEITEENELASPFDTDLVTAEINFDDEKIREKLKEILPEKDHHLIKKIIDDKKIFSNDLNYEKGVFRDKEGNLLEVFNGEKGGFDVPLHIIDTGAKDGLSIMSHNHMNGLVIPSLKDIKTVNLVQSKYNPIYSPNKTGLLINNNVSENKDIRREIANKYDRFLEDKKLEIQKLYPDKAKKIKDKFSGTHLEKKLDDELHRPYYVKNQNQIVKEINSIFKENNFDIKLYIL